MPGLILSIIILLVALYGYYYSIKISKLEKEIRRNNLDYECFECKTKMSVNEIKCPNCSFVTLYGKRKKKFWIIIPIMITWIFMITKFSRLGII